MPKYFGTDGIRGIPFNHPLTEENIIKFAYSIGSVLKDTKKIAYVAMDTRKSGKKIANLLSKGLKMSGVNVYNLGILTTPSLSYIISVKKPSFGIMISASHNPPQYNGIKVFNNSGEKVSTYVEEKIEQMFDNNLKFKQSKSKATIKDISIIHIYTDYVLSNFKGINTKELVIDCANGAAYKIAPYIFKKLGFRFKLIGAKPNGKNINVECGSLNTQNMVNEVTKNDFFCGISFDGDADRCILCDENGNIIDGDDIIMLLSYYYLKKNLFNGKKIVVLTHISNYGLIKTLRKMGIEVITVDVGDRNITQAMKKSKADIGGEPSGHIVIRKYLLTGDGIITSLAVLKACDELGIKLSDIKKMWERYPSVMKSFKIDIKHPIEKLNGFIDLIKQKEKEINGRILVRYSGTEPVLRILAEGNTSSDYLLKICNDIFEFYKKSINNIRG